MSALDSTPPAVLAGARRTAIVNYLIMMVALARRAGMSAPDLVAWVLGQFEDGGYYDRAAAPSGHERLDAFVADFVSGRRLVYDDVAVQRAGDAVEVTSALWYTARDEEPEAFYYFGLAPEDLLEYVSLLARENARLSGIALSIDHAGGRERARIALAAA